MKIVGLMSGTSGDGVDAAVVEVSGRGLTLRARALAAQRREARAGRRAKVDQEELRAAQRRPLADLARRRGRHRRGERRDRGHVPRACEDPVRHDADAHEQGHRRPRGASFLTPGPLTVDPRRRRSRTFPIGSAPVASPPGTGAGRARHCNDSML